MTALNFAKGLTCAAAGGDRPCDACAACRKVDSSAHPDVRVVKPLEDKTAITIDQVREILKDASLKPYEALKKTYIVDDAGLMQWVAQSAFLKTLEEPPPDTVFILIAERADDLFPTIVSRAESVHFLPLARAEVADILAKGHGVDVARAQVLAGLSSGRIGEAVRRAGDEAFFERRARVIDGLVDGTLFDADGEKRAREEIAVDLDIMLAWFRDILVTAAAGEGAPAVLNVDRKETIARAARTYGPGRAGRIINAILETVFYVGANVNTKLAMGVLGAEIASVTRNP